MHKHLYRTVFSFIVLSLILGCTAELPEQPSPQPVQEDQIYTFKAVFADGRTKTVIQNETSVYWSPGDSIKVFKGKYSGKFVSTNKSISDTTTFNGRLGPAGSVNIGDGSIFWSLYPYNKTATLDTTAATVTVEVPASQTAMEGTFAPGHFPAIARSQELSLNFYNVCGGVMFTVSQEGINSVIFKGNNNESIAGSAKVGFDSNGKPQVVSFSEVITEITVTAPGGTSFKPGARYYIVAYPATLSAGCSLTYEKTGTAGTFTSSKAVTIRRSVFGKVMNKDKDLTFAPTDAIISFADPIAKQACVAKFDTNKDGEVSYAEAYAASTLKGLFDNYSGVTSFEEIKYFGNVSNLEGAFNGCSKLEHITIPGNITTIGDKAFYGCSSLDEITVPSTVTSIGAQSFDSNMKTVYVSGTTPPSISADSFVVGTIFYVPASAVEVYKSNWTDHKDYIKAMLGGANSFVISSYSQHFFDATRKGNSEESVGQIASAELLWESFGTDTAPSIGDIVSDVSYRDGKVFFTASGKDGNAVIAVKDALGTILWSWHVWVCKDFDPVASAQVYKNGAGTMMDRNLGALSATPGDLGALGLLYQWGRKDPFLGNKSVTSDSPYGTSAASTITWPHATSSTASTGTIAYSIANPTTFITENSFVSDWYYTGSIETDNTRWQLSVKTMYDPCPSGWRVPAGGEDGIWAKAFGSNAEFSKGPWDSTNRGMNFGSGNGKEASMQLGSADTIWYPAAGCRSYSVGGVKYPGSNGYCWSCSPADTSAVSFFFDPTAKVIPSSGRERAAGRSVRCQREE